MNALAKAKPVSEPGYFVTVKLQPDVYEAVLAAANEQRTTREVIIAEACRAYVLGERG